MVRTGQRGKDSAEVKNRERVKEEQHHPKAQDVNKGRVVGVWDMVSLSYQEKPRLFSGEADTTKVKGKKAGSNIRIMQYQGRNASRTGFSTILGSSDITQFNILLWVPIWSMGYARKLLQLGGNSKSRNGKVPERQMLTDWVPMCAQHHEKNCIWIITLPIMIPNTYPEHSLKKLAMEGTHLQGHICLWG